MIDIQGSPSDDNRYDDSFGAHYIAEQIGKQTETVTKACVKLKDRGLIDIAGNGTRKRHYRVLHNPAWIDSSDRVIAVTGVRLGPAPTRHHTTNRRLREVGQTVPEQIGEHRAKQNERQRQERAAHEAHQASDTRDLPTAQESWNTPPSCQTGNPLPAAQDTPSRPAGRPLNLSNGSEGVDLSDVSQEEIGEDYFSPNLHKSADLSVPCETSESAEGPTVVDRATAVVALADSRESLSTTETLSPSVTQSPLPLPTIGKLRRLSAEIRDTANELGLTDDQLSTAVNYVLDADEWISTLNGLSYDQLTRVQKGLPEAAREIILDAQPALVAVNGDEIR